MGSLLEGKSLASRASLGLLCFPYCLLLLPAFSVLGHCISPSVVDVRKAIWYRGVPRPMWSAPLVGVPGRDTPHPFPLHRAMLNPQPVWSG